MFRLIAMAALVAAASAAHADDLVIESHAGERPGEADALLGPVVDALAARGFATTAGSAQAIVAEVSSPSAVLSATDLDAASRFIESGFQQFQEGNFGAALRDVEPGLATIERGLGTLITLPDLRDLRQRGLITLALARKRLGDEQLAREAAAELVRSFSDKPINTSTYSPEAVELVRDVRRELTAAGTGTIAVDTGDGTAVIFINETYAGVGKIEKTGLAPGSHRVTIRRGDVLGRLHRFEIGAGERRDVILSWSLEAALATDHSRAVLRFSSEDERAAREGELALGLATATGAKRVAVLGIRDLDGRRSVVGTVYATSSATPKGAFVTTEPTLPSAETLGALGRYLGGDDSAARLISTLGHTGDRVEIAPDRDPAPSRGSNALGWVAVGTGVAALAAGGALIAIHEDEFDDQGDLNAEARDTRVPGIVVASAGAVVAGVGIYLLIRGSGESEPGTAIHVAPTDGGLAVGLSGRF